MKHILLLGVVALSTTLSLNVMAADMGDMKMDHMDGMNMKMDAMKSDKKPGMASKAMTGHGVGVVKALDTKAGTITLAHEPIPELSWPAMTMTFKSASPKLLAKIKPGDKVAFTCSAEGMNATVTAIKPAK